MCSDGHSYERRAISTWFNTSNRSPITNLPISRNLQTNFSLLHSIQEYNSNINVNVSNLNNFCFKEVDVDSEFNNDILSITIKENILMENRYPVDFIFAIDISLSMNYRSGIPGNIESQCYSRLDLVKHSVCCIIHSLCDNDTISILVYSNNPRIIFPTQKMTTYNKQTAINLVKNIQPESSTNIWDSLVSSINLSNASIHPNPSILFFSDGQPTVGQIDIDNAFKKYLNNNKIKASIYTFGISNSVNSSLLNNISILANGQFHFISDSAMIFTVIVNFMSNYFSIYGHLFINDVFQGPIYYGKTKHVSHKVNDDDLFTIRTIDGNQQSINVSNIHSNINSSVIIDCYNTISNIIPFLDNNKFTDASNYLESFINNYRNLIQSNDFINDLLSNISDQVVMASSTQYFKTWGKHYLLSFLNAIKHQINNNFKDIAVQHFSSTTFNSFQTELNSIVSSLPPITPSLTFRGQVYNVSSMSTFNNRSNPCFSGHNKVIMGDYSTKLVQNILPGDIVHTPLGNARVNLIIKTLCKDSLINLCHINKLSVTPWHPIYFNNKWTFPNDISEPVLTQCESVYSFVLDQFHIMNIENTLVICLAHNYKHSILYHPLWGTNKIINKLKHKPDFHTGIITLHTGCVTYSPTSGIASSI